MRAWFLSASVFLLATAPLLAADWPQFRGNTGQTGVAPGKLAAAPKLLWKFKTARPVTGAPAIVKGRVYIGSTDGKIYCLDARSGRRIWEFETADEVEAAPLVLGNSVYVGASDRHFYALDAASGKLRWKFKTGDKNTGGANWFKAANGALRLVFGSHDNNLYCLDAKSGKQIWRYETPNYINGSPAISGGKAIFGGCDGAIHIVNLGSGKAAATIDTGAYIAASAAMSGSEIYVGNYGNEFMRADVNTKKVVWRYRDRSFPYFASAVLTAQNVYVGGDDRRLHCITRQSGSGVWTFNARGKVGSSPILCDGKLVFGAENGRLFLVNAATGTQLWSFDAGKAITAAPAVADGLIVIGSEDGFVYAFK